MAQDTRVLTICHTTEHGDVTVIEAEPLKPINECPTCGQPRKP
ncbi:transposase [Corynebacterium diphtheriae]|nr:transposase [Corynebacterium diphtheriae]OWM44348.1 transposase [Corynebacterium diphtheriae]OWM52333.1 transposase [Corynebacterium diphtheriae]OWM53115.1 transposase [Corynebacterium diphtheriae]OWM58279.1 transposase [Corynebacterium diphtheriae]